MVRINPRWVLLVLLAADTALLLMFLLGEAGHIPIWTLQRLTLMNAEGDLPTWLSSTQLLIVGVLLLLRSAALRNALLGLGALAFIALSIDEATALHESITMTLHHHAVQPWSYFPQPHQAEIVTLGMYGLAGLFLLAWRRGDLPALLREPYIKWLAAGMAIIVLGGMFLDTLWPRDLWPKSIGDAIEEYLELIGASVMVYASLRAVHGLRLHVAPASRISQPPRVAAENTARRETGAGRAHAVTTASARAGSE